MYNTAGVIEACFCSKVTNKRLLLVGDNHGGIMLGIMLGDMLGDTVEWSCLQWGVMLAMGVMLTMGV